MIANCRSYYRCTSQKCSVKKRVERSFQDPTTVITTYEGVHTHPSPATLRGSTASMLAPSILTPTPSSVTNFHQDLFMQMPSTNFHQGDPSSLYLQSLSHNQRLQLPDYGLLQDVIPPFIRKQPWMQPTSVSLSVHIFSFVEKEPNADMGNCYRALNLFIWLLMQYSFCSCKTQMEVCCQKAKASIEDGRRGHQLRGGRFG